ncbi:MAG: hypothetical protein QM594_04795 [Niabella sp.]
MSNFFRGWDVIRIIRLLLGIAIIAQSVRSGHWGLMIAGILFSLMPIFNIGCCAGGNCSAPVRSVRQTENSDISYEEIK